MTNDIVNRLRNKAKSEVVADGFLQIVDKAGLLHLLDTNVHTEAADEIEHLRKERDKWKSLCEGIVEAITNEGREPFVHRRIIAKHRSEWMTLWERIDKAIKAVTNGK